LETLILQTFDTILDNKQNVYLYIVTNAEEGWVQNSCSQYMPNLYQYLLLHNIPIISARTRHEKKFPPNSLMEWKREAYIDIFNSFHTSSSRFRVGQILCLTDASYDRVAFYKSAIHVFGSDSNLLLKSMKLLEKPTIDSLIAQHRLISSAAIQLLSNPKKFDLRLTKTLL
jgi:hypothetical protein